ncbi:MAG: CvpA family protein [Rhodanobacter sp.]
MNWTDYAIIGILGLSIMVGLWRGLVSEVLALVIWVAAFWVAWWFGPVVAARFEHVIELPSARIIFAYMLCFVAVLIVGALLRFVVRRLIESTGLSGTDRLLGMLFGFARGVLLVTLLVFLLGFTASTRDPWWQQSVLLPHFQQVAAWIGQRVPADVGKYLNPQRVLEHLPSLHAPVVHPISGATAPAPATSVISAPAAPARTPSSARTQH